MPKTTEQLFEEIPSCALGDTPDNLPRFQYGQIIVKRALLAGYEEGDPEQMIIDLLADLRHTCDKLALDFAALDHKAHQAYLNEKP